MSKFLALLALVSAGRAGKTRSMLGITTLHANTRVSYGSLCNGVVFVGVDLFVHAGLGLDVTI